MTSRVLASITSLGLGCALAACGIADSADPASDPASATATDTARRDNDHDGIHKVKHVIVVMQENHSFDNYFGALAYAPGSPYHSPDRRDRRYGRDDRDRDRDDDDDRGCSSDDNRCVDGLTCTVDRRGQFHCANHNG